MPKLTLSDSRITRIAKENATDFYSAECLMDALRFSCSTEPGGSGEVFPDYVLYRARARGDSRSNPGTEEIWAKLSTALHLPYIEVVRNKHNDPNAACREKLRKIYGSWPRKGTRKGIQTLRRALWSDDYSSVYYYPGNRYSFSVETRWGNIVHWDTLLQDIAPLSPIDFAILDNMIALASSRDVEIRDTSERSGIIHQVAHQDTIAVCNAIGNFFKTFRPSPVKFDFSD